MIYGSILSIFLYVVLFALSFYLFSSLFRCTDDYFDLYEREDFLIRQYSILFLVKNELLKEGKNVDFEIRKMNEIENELFIIRSSRSQNV